MTEIGFFLTVGFCLAVLGLGRRYAALAFLGATLYITQGQTLEIGGVNMMAIRFVEVAAAIRVLSRREATSMRLTAVDHRLLFFFVAYMGIVLARTGTLDKYTPS